MNNLEQISKNFTEDYALVSSNEALNDLRVKYLGKTGVLTDALKAIKDIPVAEKKAYGESVNELKKSIEAKLETLKLELENREIEAKLSSTKVVDLTIPSRTNEGSLHPVTIASHKVVEVFRSMGFLVEDGFEVETEYNNFEAVNIPKNHPARDMQDTFWLENDQVLRTHTSANQNRVMKKYGAPLRAIFPGRCYRNETLDASHDTTFWQLEGMVIDENISIANLIYFMKTMLTKVFGKEINVRLRPGFFPFTEPSFELDCTCPYCEGKGCKVCKQGGWIELCPCGMIHPEVLKMGGIDTNKYQGFAFGLGLSRLAMMNKDIDTIRIMNGCKLKELKQAKIK
ncbi:MAG: phenylalanine--tRNA ligase subunit alpha [Clostridia bacterium]|nr:phenylalanine--tRNA ligase subunit alpha [Clostridia bacterium]